MKFCNAILAIVVCSMLLLIPQSGKAAGTTPSCGKSFNVGMTSQKLITGGLERNYLLYIPASYDGSKAVPLVISIHGFASNSSQQASYAGWEKVADREGSVVIYPQGTGTPARWYAGNTTFFSLEQPVDDVSFFSDLLDSVSGSLCIDAARIFVNGLSNGGGMSERLACNLSLRIAAIGTVSGAYSSLEKACEPQRPIPIIAFHGDDDPIVDYKGSARLRFPAIPTWAADWAKRDSCQNGPDVFFKNEGAAAIRWTDCAGNAEVQLYTLYGGGHSWPGSSFILPEFIVGKTSQAVDATMLMWAFFIAHPIPPSP